MLSSFESPMYGVDAMYGVDEFLVLVAHNTLSNKMTLSAVIANLSVHRRSDGQPRWNYEDKASRIMKNNR